MNCGPTLHPDLNSYSHASLSSQVTDFDAKLANFRNYRPLSKEAVLGHLADFGLEEVRRIIE